MPSLSRSAGQKKQDDQLSLVTPLMASSRPVICGDGYLMKGSCRLVAVATCVPSGCTIIALPESGMRT